ncbi:MAG: methionyl-tRNA formyltransferase, partial [Candidatus Omnitrophica bacterium]|nr:methionyl-tRNA formyltransferase [Candidatus Omnitrophota bacterium]
GKALKVLTAQILDRHPESDPGTILQVVKDGIEVAAKGGVLRILKVKPEGKKEMSSWSFACGYRVKPGDRLGEG